MHTVVPSHLPVRPFSGWEVEFEEEKILFTMVWRALGHEAFYARE